MGAGAALSITLGILVGVATAILSVSLALGLIAALIVGVLSTQIQILMMMERADAEAHFLLRKLGPVINAINLDEPTGKYLLKLAEAQVRFLKANPRPPAIFGDELAHQSQRLLERYSECSQGRMSVSLVAAPILRETDGVSTVKERLWATSLVPPRTYWDVASGKTYLRQQEEMLEDGISIKRIFIHPRETLDELSNVVATHMSWRQRFGVELLDARVVLLDDELDDDLVVDFAVVDDATVISLATQHGINHPVAVVWDAGSQAIVNASARFERLWQCGQDPAEFPIFQD